MPTTNHKRRWSSRIGTIIRRTSKSRRINHSISFDQDAEFVPRNCDDSEKTLPHVALDIQPSTLSTLCTIAESPLREAEATQSAAGLCLGGPVYEVNTPSSESLTYQAVDDLPKPIPPISQIGEISITPSSTSQDPIYNELQAKELPQLDSAKGPILTAADEGQTKVPPSESTDKVSTASFHEMTHCSSVNHTVPSNSSLSATSRRQLSLDLGHIDTCFPLSTSHDAFETSAITHSSDDDVIPWFPYSASSDKLEKLQTIGWLEYRLPNGNLYYFHPERKISTDVDLTSDAFLDLVEAFWMDVSSWSSLRRNSNLAVTLNEFIEDEIWLKDVGSSNEDSKMMFEMWRVNHVARTMVLAGQEINNGGTATVEPEHQIDMEHRYWAFMQSHPAHTVLPPNAKSAAINTLAWAWTDHLLSLRHSDYIPFTREECRDLMTLLQSLIVEKHHHQVIQTCIVARVFLQVAQWHKSRRYDKASPTDTSMSISEPLNQFPDPPKFELEKLWVVRHIVLNLVIFISILLFILFYGVLGQKGLTFTHVQVFMYKLVGSLGQASASLRTFNWVRTLRWMGWSGLRDAADTTM